ncbi:MAG: hypothetical protein IT160_07085 [Bryobacterales bacterium]|nr:hypothetical protein [Bryobacterales bacterium]
MIVPTQKYRPVYVMPPAPRPLSGLGLSLPSIDFKDPKILAIAAVVVILLVTVLGKKASQSRRRKLMLARLRWAEESARIRRGGK